MARMAAFLKVTFTALACMALCGLTSLYGQASIEVDGTVREKESNRKLSGVEVNVLRAGQDYDAVSTLSNGKYSLSLDHGSDYVLIFTFDELSPRKVELNTSSIPDEFRDRPFYLTVEMSLFEVPPGFDQALLNAPIGKVSFDASKEQLAWDLDYTGMMQNRIEEELASASASGDDGANEEYEEHMRKAEVEFGRERWAQSINWLDRALNALPGDARALDMIEDARRRQEEAEALANVQRDYDASMREGKMAMRKESWSEAAAAFRTALSLLPDESEPAELLAEVEAAQAGDEAADSDGAYDDAVAEGTAALDAGNLDLAQASFEQATELKPSERLPKEKLAEIRQLRKAEEREANAMSERLQEYEDLIEQADRNFDSRDFVRAKSLYEQASVVMPDEVYPRTRALEANGLIVNLGGDAEPEETAVDASAASGLDREYEDRIREGDEAFDAEDWATAKQAYNAALEIRPEERYPRNRLKRISSITEGEEDISGDLEVDRQAMLDENESAAADAAARALALKEEQDRLLEEERQQTQLSEDRKTADSKSRRDAERDRSRNYVLAMQDAEEDDAEAYYRNALASEIKARGQAVYARVAEQQDLEEVWLSNSDTRRQSSFRELSQRQEEQSVNQYESASYRQDRMADLDARQARHDEQTQDWSARGKAGRRDKLITLTRKTEDNQRALYDRTKRYAVFVDSLDRMLSAYADFNRDLRKASIDTRIMRYEDIERTAARHRKVGEGEDIRRLERWNGIQRQERDAEQAKSLASGEAALRSAAALRRVQEKESGSVPTSEDYKEVPAMEGIRQGVEERSYEEGNALIIERTVRVDNEVNVYRKTVAKHGVYYFKNDRSITREIWVLETFEISD